jgi:hypothetical protein
MDIAIDYLPSEKQILAHRLPNKYKMYGGAVGGGKTYWLCAEAIFHAVNYPGNRILMCRHHLSNFRNSTLVTLMKLLPANLIKRHNSQLCEIELINGSVILYMGLGSPEEKQKLGSMELAVICIDEASEVDLDVFLMACNRIERWVLPNGTRPPYYMLLASNPANNWLKEYFIDNPKDGFVFIQALPKDNPHLSDKYIKDLEKIYPKEWIQKYLEGDWNALGGDNKIIPYEHISAAINREIVIEDKPLIACDPAAFGDDENVIIYSNGPCVLDIRGDRKQDPMITSGRFTQMYNKHNCKGAIIETDGLGIGIYSRLKEMGVNVQKFQSGSSPVGEASRKKFYNLKTQAWFHARQMFEDGLVSIPKDEILIRQLSAMTYDVRDSGGKLWVEPKGSVKKRMGQSPDRADALVMLLWLNRFVSSPNRKFTKNRMGKAAAILGSGQKNGYGW